ncbi:50S ribosomal protein L25/general stress protein Ctc [Saccharospirillum sp. MSK14-1]|uniref:50S ribosomal protein L25/general stress protein Ctc n=1 Tax=Saccharospirillum sp. MSK14-1 TaxID=1897632 RepID=UPI000D33C7F9|nr:50S ribosomal protein L25/general stress protein Ctc [Saccharospirillum sp. MSK14-1]PTY36182.1 50S ribosomal protein L25/general stress protein Ctc [Saccharospirillum sp. MSK14-1]
MSDIFTLNAEVREVAGKGASRRLRREGWVPAIIYGGAKNRKPMSLTLKERELSRALKEEAFYSHVLTINIGDKSEQAILMDIQRSPAKGLPLHADFERVTKTTVVHKRVPLHFINEDKCKAVKLQGGKIQHTATDVEVTCKVGDLPEFIEVDVADLELGAVLHLSDLKLPKGVTLTELNKGESHDVPVVSIAKPAGVDSADEDDDAEAEADSEE